MDTQKTYTCAELFSLNQTEQILTSKAEDIKKNFYHYTTFENLQKILTGDNQGNHFFFVRSINDMNDRNEARWHQEDGDKIHSFCTCCTKHEKIPLWYLYSGICGRGVRLGITPGKMLKFLRDIELVYPVIGGKVDYSTPLRIHNDFDLLCGWVYYLMDGNNRIFYRNSYYTTECIDENALKTNYFIKNYPWEYEREFRIIIKNKTAKSYERVAIPVPNTIIESLEIMSAPEYTFSDAEKENCIGLGIKPEKIKKSDLNIKMDLLRGNKADILEQIDAWCDEDQCGTICSFVKTRNRCAKQEV